MNICINGAILTPPFSGVETSLDYTIEGLMKYGENDYTIFAPTNYNRDVPMPHRKLLIRCLNKSKHQRIIWEHTKLPTLLKRESFDLLHCPSYIAPFRSPLPYTLTVHDCFAITHPQRSTLKNRIYYKLLLKHSIRHAKRLITPSQFVKDTICDLFKTPNDKISVIPHGISEQFFTPITPEQKEIVRKRYNLPSKFLLFCGNIEPKKNLSSILAAFETVHVSHPDIHLFITAPKLWKANNILSKINDNHIHIFQEYINKEDIPTLYALATLVLLPSLAEGFGLPIIEAMSCGTPVITSNTTACNEVASACALKISPNSSDELSTAINRLLEDKTLYEDYVKKGYHHAKEFTLKKHIKTLEQFFKLSQMHSS